MIDTSDLSYFAYIQFGINDLYYIRLDSNEIVKKVLGIRIGDIFQIRHIGTLQVVNIFPNEHKFEEGGTFYELGFTCNKVVL